MVIMEKFLLNIFFPKVEKIQQEECGFTLLETLVAMTIFGLVAVIFLMGLSISSKAVMVSQNRVTAESIAKSQMEDTKAQKYVVDASSYPEIALSQDMIDQGML